MRTVWLVAAALRDNGAHSGDGARRLVPDLGDCAPRRRALPVLLELPRSLPRPLPHRCAREHGPAVFARSSVDFATALAAACAATSCARVFLRRRRCRRRCRGCLHLARRRAALRARRGARHSARLHKVCVPEARRQRRLVRLPLITVPLHHDAPCCLGAQPRCAGARPGIGAAARAARGCHARRALLRAPRAPRRMQAPRPAQQQLRLPAHSSAALALRLEPHASCARWHRVASCCCCCCCCCWCCWCCCGCGCG